MRLAFARQKRKQHITRNNPVKRLDLHLGTEVVEIYIQPCGVIPAWQVTTLNRHLTVDKTCANQKLTIWGQVLPPSSYTTQNEIAVIKICDRRVRLSIVGQPSEFRKVKMIKPQRACKQNPQTKPSNLLNCALSVLSEHGLISQIELSTEFNTSI